MKSRLHGRTAAACFTAILFSVPALAGVRVVEPYSTPHPHRNFGFDFGPRVSWLLPTGQSAQGFERGIDAGFELTSMQSRHVGIGIEVGYQHWPSPQAGRAYDQLFSAFGHAPVRGTKVFVDGWRAAGHVTIVPLQSRTVRPWLEMGLGVVRMRTTIEFPVNQLVAAGWTIHQRAFHGVSDAPEFAAGGGVDFRVGRALRAGPDLSYRWIYPSDAQALTAFEVGCHLRFGDR